MSELKARGVDDVYIEYYNTGKHELSQVYLKSEADKVITHHKYKRCLANANVCAEKLYRRGLTIDGYKFYCKWLRRWLAIAERFKEAK